MKIKDTFGDITEVYSAHSRIFLKVTEDNQTSVAAFDVDQARRLRKALKRHMLKLDLTAFDRV